MSQRLSVNINDETAQALKEMAARRQTTVTEIIRRAVSMYKFVEDEVTENGKSLQLASPDEVTTILMV